MKFNKFIFPLLLFSFFSFFQNGCNFLTHETLSRDSGIDSTSDTYEPNYNVSLDFNYQDFISYLYIGNRVENFTAYFNTFFIANQDFDQAFDEYRASLISYYNRRLDSLGESPAVSASVKEKLEKSIERASKIIQFHNNSKFMDDAVLLIGKSYYILTDYFKAERTFNEFLSKLSSSILADEAILYHGRTKVKLGKMEEGETIFKNLVKNSEENEIRSLAARELGILAYNKGNLENAANYFKASIDFSIDQERRAEGQFILAKILSVYKPELAAKEYRKVLDYTSDYDLTFYSRLNYAKGLIKNKDFLNTSEELTDLRKKYRDETAFTQLVDLEIANNLNEQKNFKDAHDKYYEVIVKYPNTASSSDAYYYLAKYEEEVNNDYVNALVNYKKAVGESSASDYYRESSAKSSTLEKYFGLLNDLGDSVKINIPTANAEVEKFRKTYNEEKGINQPIENKDGVEQTGNTGNTNTGEDDGSKKGEGKGKPGGFKDRYFKMFGDSLKEESPNPSTGPMNPANNPQIPRGQDYEKKRKIKSGNDSVNFNGTDSLSITNDSLNLMNDSLRAIEDSLKAKDKADKIFNAYYELAELFMYNLNQSDSTEYYLKLLLDKFPESDKQAKVLYTLGDFYKNINREVEAQETFSKVISTYPNTIYANESRKILGIKTNVVGITLNAVDDIFKQAMNLFIEQKYAAAIFKLQDVEIKYPNDSIVAKSLYSIGWIYENKIVNKDSSLLYYRRLKEKFPQSEYTQKISPMLDYIASLEVNNTTDSTNSMLKDSVNSEVKEALKDTTKTEEVVIEKKVENSDEVKPDSSNVNSENKLSQEEIEKLLKEGDSGEK